ncbi:MAG: hypothetical protein LBS83_00085 [Holosporales bacterium]|jgi:hypothetical protein|nr:hypothetical protein [Holosporales bacterium]
MNFFCLLEFFIFFALNFNNLCSSGFSSEQKRTYVNENVVENRRWCCPFYCCLISINLPDRNEIQVGNLVESANTEHDKIQCSNTNRHSPENFPQGGLGCQEVHRTQKQTEYPPPSSHVYPSPVPGSALAYTLISLCAQRIPEKLRLEIANTKELQEIIQHSPCCLFSPFPESRSRPEADVKVLLGRFIEAKTPSLENVEIIPVLGFYDGKWELSFLMKGIKNKIDNFLEIVKKLIKKDCEQISVITIINGIAQMRDGIDFSRITGELNEHFIRNFGTPEKSPNSACTVVPLGNWWEPTDAIPNMSLAFWRCQKSETPSGAVSFHMD